MTQFLPDTLRVLFAPRPPIEYKPPVEELVVNRKRASISGIAEYIRLFENPSCAPPKLYIESRAEKRERKRTEKKELWAYKLEQNIAMWAPAANPDATTDPYKTLFVARINYETSENKLRREFERYGKIEKLMMPTDKKGKPRGYAFIEYEHKEDMSKAYKKADRIVIDNRRLIVDYERGRTTTTWLPRRLGGGKGNSRRSRPAAAVEVEREARYDPNELSLYNSWSVRTKDDDRGGRRTKDDDRGGRRTKDEERGNERTRDKERSDGRSRDEERSDRRSRNKERMRSRLY